MNDVRGWHAWRDNRLELSLHVQPRAGRTEVAGLHGDRLKLRLAAPPVDGAANAALCAFLATAFGVAKSKVRLLGGELSREKRVAIETPASLPDWFMQLGGAARP